MRRAGRWIFAVLVVAAALGYGQAAPRTLGGYADQAKAASELLRSQVQTARLWIAAVQADQVTRPAALVAFREAEEDAVVTAGRFSSLDPPDAGPAAGALSERVTAAADETVSALRSLRIAGRTGQWDSVTGMDGALDRLQQRLQALGEAATA